MKKHGFPILISAINIFLIVLFLVKYTNASYPMIGLDYRLFLTRLLDSHLYYKANGFGIEWYTPNFGGGLPAYPNPLQMQFSLPQLITWFISPYFAVLASTAIFIAIGFYFTYLFLRKVLELKPLSAILGADFFLINGFIIERVVVGHVNFLTFPLIIIPIYAILDNQLPKWFAGILISLTGAILVYSGGVYIAVIGLYSALIIFPLLYLIKPELFSWRRILSVFFWGGILSAVICGSKLFATAEYMRFFPRTVHDSFKVDWLTGVKGLVFQLVGPMNWYPILSLLHKTSASYTVRLNEWTGTPYGFWELDSSLTPGLIFLIILGGLQLIFRKHKLDIGRFFIRKIVAGIFLLFSIILVSQFAIAKGYLYEQLGNLPVLQSLHADTRFTASFILPLAIVAAKVFDGWAGNWKPAIKPFLAFTLLSGVSLASMWAYFIMPLDIQQRFFNVNSVNKTYLRSSNGEAFPVRQIVSDMNDYEVFMFDSSNVSRHYDPLFRDNNILLKPLVHDGSVFDVQDGYYNMTNPSSLVFPEVNNATFFERIPVSDYTKLVDFIDRRPSDWKLPLSQIIFDWASGITFLIEICAIMVFFVKPRIKSFRH